jgi:hypothetical protein
MKCLLKRVLPFILTLTIGLLLVISDSSLNFQKQRTFNLLNKQKDASSKTWLIIRSMPAPNYTEKARKWFMPVRVLVLLDASGTVSIKRPVTKAPGFLIDEAVNAAKRIEFIPPTKDGKPFSVSVVIEYNIYSIHGQLGDAYAQPISFIWPESSEDWRVVYE